MPEELILDYTPHKAQKQFHECNTRFKAFVGGIGCFEGNTLIQTSKGYKKIKDINKGDFVLSFNELTGLLVFSRIKDKFIYSSTHTSIRVISLKLKNTEIICTENHEFYYRKKWITAIELGKRAMERNSRNKQKILDKQFRANKNKKLQKQQTRKNNETSSRSMRLFENNDFNKQKISNSKNSSVSVPCFYSESIKQTRSKPQGQPKIKQQSRKFRVDNSSREYGSCNEERKTIYCKRRRTCKFNIDRRESQANKNEIQTKDLYKKNVSQRVWSINSNNQRRALQNLEACQIKLSDIIGFEFYNKPIKLYDLSVNNTFTYLVSENNFIVHNSGKTLGGAIEAIRYMIENPGSGGIIVAPNYPMMITSTLPTFFEKLPSMLIQDIHKGERKITLKNGSWCFYRSAEDPDTLRGPNLSWFWPDEASLMPGKAFEILLGRIRDERFPCRGWVTTTPKGFNWVYEKFVKKKSNKYELIHCSSRNNPYLSKDFIESLQEDYSGAFARQEIEGDFVAMEGAVYSMFSRLKHVLNPKDCKKKVFKSVIYGVDWGFTNPSVILAIGLDSDNRAYILEEFYQRRVMIEDLVKAAKGMKEKYGDGVFYADPSEPQFIMAFNNAGLSCVGAKNDIMAGINKVGSMLEEKGDGKPALFVDASCVNTIMEFENYCYPDVKEGRPDLDKPLKIHDHAMDCCKYALLSLNASSFAVLDELGELFDSE